jgi:hypothetical protein
MTANISQNGKKVANLRAETEKAITERSASVATVRIRKKASIFVGKCVLPIERKERSLPFSAKMRGAYSKKKKPAAENKISAQSGKSIGKNDLAPTKKSPENT